MLLGRGDDVDSTSSESDARNIKEASSVSSAGTATHMPSCDKACHSMPVDEKECFEGEQEEDDPLGSDR